MSGRDSGSNSSSSRVPIYLGLLGLSAVAAAAVAAIIATRKPAENTSNPKQTPARAQAPAPVSAQVNHSSLVSSSSVSSSAPAARSSNPAATSAPTAAAAATVSASAPASASVSPASLEFPPLSLLSSSPSVRVSASGKVLLTGGYLVLFREYSGLVFALSARFHTTVMQLNQQFIEKAKFTPPPNRVPSVPILVFAPQRASSPAAYWLTDDSTGLYTLSRMDQAPVESSFVDLSLFLTLNFLRFLVPSSVLQPALARGMLIQLQGDHQFYTAEPPKKIEPLDLSKKTGLGSSAALVASLVGGLFQHFRLLSTVHSELALSPSGRSAVPFGGDSNFLLGAAHNLAQLVHCIGQGKIGSGFDISAAFYGSHRYTRFSPSFIQEFVEKFQPSLISQPTTEQAVFVRSALISAILPKLAPLSDRAAIEQAAFQQWDNQCTTLELPAGLELLLFDVQGGSKTPALVSAVLAWHRSSPTESRDLFDRLAAANGRVEEKLRQLAASSRSNASFYRDTLVKCAQLPASQWSWLSSAGLGSDLIDSTVLESLIDLRTSFSAVRALLRELTRCSGAAIEPSEQSQVLDRLMDQPGVVMAGIPGAGGNDAIFVVRVKLEGEAEGESAPDIAASSSGVAQLCRMLASEFPNRGIRLLPVTRADGGLKWEDAKYAAI